MNSIESNKYKDYFQPGTSLAHVIEEYQSNQSILSQTDSEKLSFNDSENFKYKTELCRNYSMYGFCSYSNRCQFAHGFDELRGRTRHPKYKTELCRNYLLGFCKYGSRCQFLHQTNLSPTVVNYFLTNLLAQYSSQRQIYGESMKENRT